MKIFATAILIFLSYTLKSNAHTSADNLHEVAFQRMVNEGWTPVDVRGVMAKNNTDYFVVQTSHMSTWAIEIPFMCRFPIGRYWAQTAFMSGVSSMIDASGVEHSFTFSDRFELE